MQILALAKIKASGETYLFIFPNTAAGSRDAHEAMARFAENPDLAFTWDDVCELSQEAGSMAE